MSCRSWMHEAAFASVCVVLGACGSVVAPDSRPTFAPGAALSEDDSVARALQVALSDFLRSVRHGEFDDAHTDAAERLRHPFYYRSLLRGAKDAETVVLKSSPLGLGGYRITVAFVSGELDSRVLTRIVEVDATPFEGTYRFGCPYERRTANLNRRTIGSVTYRFHGKLDTARAEEFVRLKERLERRMGRRPKALEYDCFESLEALLRAFGLVHDASKCNFLRHDLGFLWDDGRRYTTGTGDPGYVFGYVHGLLSENARDREAVFGPYANGVAAYYGGYGLSGDSLEVLARQFREAVAQRPRIDFLEEFKKGRGASIERHFCHYVMCAFFCREIVDRHGEAAALALVECGAKGERFFGELERLLGVTEENFHDTILRLIRER